MWLAGGPSKCCRLHALGAALVPGGISKEVVVTQVRSLLWGIRPEDAASSERHRQAVELIDDIDHLDVVGRDSRAPITAAVTASATTVTEIFGVGPIVAAMLIGYRGDPTRFATASHYAAYTGTAREAIRALNRRLSDVVWQHLVADTRRAAAS